MSAPAVSIITPTYNHERFLPQCLDSVLAQTSGSWEMIVADDGSTDGTPELMKRYRDPRIRYCPQKNLGIDRLAETYNRALAQCRAPLVAILEGDDWWPADKLARLVPAFSDDAVVLAYGLTQVVSDGFSRHPPTIPVPRFFRLFPASVLTNSPVGSAALAMLDPRGLTYTYPCSVLLRRAALDRIGGFQARAGLPLTDYPTFLRLAVEGRFQYEPSVMGYWRVHGASTTMNRWEAILTGVWNETQEFRRRFGSRLPLATEHWDRIDRSWRAQLAWLDMREARRRMLARDWSAARRLLVGVVRRGRLHTRAAALAALASTWTARNVEPYYRFFRHAWLRLRPDGRFDVVQPAPRGKQGS